MTLSTSSSKYRVKSHRLLSPVLLLCLLLLPVLTVVADEKRNREREESLRKETSDQYLKKWLDQDVIYIISEEERAAFKQLATDEERYQFIEQFWLRRDPTPETIENEFRDEHYQRIAYANERFGSGWPGWQTDRGRIYITWGPPDQVESRPSGSDYVRSYEDGGGTMRAAPYEIWRYRYLEGTDLGNEVIIEFIDPTMTGKYEIALHPDEKAMTVIPGHHLVRLGQSILRREGMPVGRAFDRLRQMAGLQRAPKVKFKDLETVVDTKLSYNLLPFDFRTDYIKITDDTVLTTITLQIQHQDMTFQHQDGVQIATVNVYGRISTITGRVAHVFEEAVRQQVPESLFKQSLQSRSLYQAKVPLRSGLYKLELVLKDLNSGNVGTVYQGLRIPKFPEDQLATSSIILADKIEKLPLKQVTGPFVIGGSRVLPNVKGTFNRNKIMGIYFQIYNLTLDEKTRKPSATVDYVLQKEGQEISRITEASDKLAGASQQMTLEWLLQLNNLESGPYSLLVHVTDNLSKRTTSPVARFEVR